MTANTETHPFAPFLPERAHVLMLGTFPPAPHRWCMPFYYPNFNNDMWRIMGIIFYGDKGHFIVPGTKAFDQQRIEQMLREKGIALYDTATEVVRTRNTASDKDLLIVRETDIRGLLARLPECHTVITAGQLATTTLCRQLDVPEPRTGESVTAVCMGRGIRIWRMPSSSRAYPMRTEDKAEAYKTVLSV